MAPIQQMFLGHGPATPSFDNPYTYYGARGIGAGGYSNTNVIQYINIASTGNASDFGDMIQTSRARATASNGSRGMFMGGRSGSPGPDLNCEYITTSSTGNGTNFGDLTVIGTGGYSSGASNQTYAYCFGGACCGNGTDSMEYFTIASTGNGTNFGTLAGSTFGAGSTNNSYRACLAGARGYNDPAFSKIQYFTMGTSGNSTNGGDLTVARGYVGACMSVTSNRGVWMGGMSPSTSNINTMDYINLDTTDNATDFGDLVTGVNSVGNAGTFNESARGILMGGESPGAENQIQYISIDSASNAQDFGDMLLSRSHVAALSGAAS